MPSIAFAIPGTVKAASGDSGSSAALGRTGASRSASAWAISSVWREAQTPEQEMQLRPLLTSTLSTITSRYFSQSSTTSSPSRILLKPGPCGWTRGSFW